MKSRRRPRPTGPTQIRVRSIRKVNPDPKRIARALIAYARQQQAKAEEQKTAKADVEKQTKSTSPDESKDRAA